jgi:3-oxoadipate enol-lactonase
VNVHYRFDGARDAPVLVLSSSLGTTLELWDANVVTLASRHRVLRYDHRGHGRSPAPPGPYTVDELADDVLELLDEHGLDRVAFCGISLGGAVGMALARRAPERLERLALCCTAARFGEPEMWEERARTVRADGPEAIVDAVLARWFTPAFHERRPDVIARFRATFVATPREGYAACCDALAGWDFRDELASLRVPTLAVAAEHDPSTPPALLVEIAEGIPGATLVVLPDAAHLVNVEQAEAFTATILEAG